MKMRMELKQNMKTMTNLSLSWFLWMFSSPSWSYPPIFTNGFFRNLKRCCTTAFFFFQFSVFVLLTLSLHQQTKPQCTCHIALFFLPFCFLFPCCHCLAYMSIICCLVRPISLSPAPSPQVMFSSLFDFHWIIFIIPFIIFWGGICLFYFIFWSIYVYSIILFIFPGLLFNLPYFYFIFPIVVSRFWWSVFFYILFLHSFAVKLAPGHLRIKVS